jgi:DNA-binding NarL/FixJ family response regulator
LVAAGRLTALTDAERDVLERIARGMTTQQVAASRGTKVSTVRRQRHVAYGKLGAHDRATVARLLGYGPTAPRPADRIREILDR